MPGIHRRVIFPTILICLFISATFLEADQPPVAKAEVHSLGISWQPMIDFESVMLTVSGPGDFVLQREFGSAESLHFAIDDFDDAGLARLADGQYAYELRFAPRVSAEVREALRQARETNDTSVVTSLKKQGKLPDQNLVHSGYFRVKDGAVVAAEAQESVSREFASTSRRAPAGGDAVSDSDGVAKDQQILDDLIVDGSACIGQDCVNGESFGVDTIRIKENNLRIKAQDTSSTASFPTNDWQITFNDSSNGGANKFSIDDIDGGRTPFTIEASAPSHSLYVDDGGRLGLGTATPVTDIHVVSGNTPTLRLEQDGSSGFTPQTWDVAGNEANFFIRDASNGSTLPFRIRPSTPTSGIDMFSDRIEINGAGGNYDTRIEGDTNQNVFYVDASADRIGIGTDSPDAPLEVVPTPSNVGAGNAVLKLVNPSGPVALQFDADDDGTSFWNVTAVSGDNLFRINRNGGGTDLELDSTTGNLTIFGSIFTSGGTCGSGCDTVFQEDYPLASIEEHARLMWRSGHLPNVGPTPENQPINLSETTGRMLNELEKAHIYIEQLHRRLEKLEAMVREQ